MNCLHTRRTLLANPHADSPALSTHLAQCDACRQFAQRLACDEMLLRAAMSVAPPEQLAERILLRTKLRSRQPGWFRWIGDWSQPRRAGYAAAASAVLALGLWWTVPSPENPAQWSEVMLAHVIGEPAALAKNTPIASQVLNEALGDYGLALKAGMGTLRFFDHCALPGGRGIHAVIETPDLGKVTLILPPRGTRAAPGATVREGFAAQIVHIGQASVGLVADRPENIAVIVQRLRGQLVTNT
jgi:hypothetical protein